MSYLVDALKKAERERQLRRAADMQSLSTGEAGAGRAGGGSLMNWVVLALIVGNLALAAYVLVFGGAPDRPANDPPGANAQSSAAPRTSEPATVRARPAQKTEAADTTAPDSVSEMTSTLRLSEETTETGARSAARGRVTYAQSPLDDTSLAPALPAKAAPAAAPKTTIKGHLYSSVPGRSFILVEGRRYHEGERLAAGPAVESIDARGATLNYQGQRYHVDGPG